MKLFINPKSKFYWYDFRVRGRRYRGSTPAQCDSGGEHRACPHVIRACGFRQQGVRKSDWLPSTAGQGIQFLGTEGSLSVLLGAGMVEQAEYKRENYDYSIDSWPKAMQEAFLNQDNHRAE